MEWHNKVFVFDNIISLEKQEEIKSVLLSDTFPWFYQPDVTNAAVLEKRPGFAHVFVSTGGKINSPHHELVLPIVKNACEKVDMRGERKYLQGRTFLQLSLNLKNYDLDMPHVDLRDFKHMVVLYYVKDADGETVIYNEQYTDDKNIPKNNDLTEKTRVMPKQGRVVIFDGFYWHTAAQPQNGNDRCIINYNVV